MKLRNLMYATMIACAFASCSKDDAEIVGPDGPDAEANATLDVKVLSLDTKTVVPSVADDAKINSLKLVVFTPDNANAYSVEVVGTVNGEGTADKAVKATVKPGVKKVLVLANYSETIAKGTSLTDVLALTQTFSNENSTKGFSMNSQIFDITVVPSKTNYLGYGSSASTPTTEYLTQAGAGAVKLYRNVAKVRLDEILFKVKSQKQYPGATLTLKRVFVLHAKNNTKVASTTAWEATESGTDLLIGATVGEYQDPWVKYMEATNTDGSARKPVYNYVKANTPAYSADVEAYNKDITTPALSYDAKYTTPQTFYVYENTATSAGLQTLLVVEATFAYTDPNNQDAPLSYDRFYPVAVGENADFTKVNNNTADFPGRTPLAKDAGVLRNLAYGITMTISGPGYETPFGPKPDGGDPEQPGGDTFLDTQVKVVAFGEVTQTPDVE